MKHLSALPLLLLLAGCGSSPGVSSGDAPGWVHQPARSVDAGYIVYVGSGEDRNPDRAKLKAEAQAWGDLANECSFAPKGARVEDRYELEEHGIYRVYVKTGIDFARCEDAKAATDPEAIRKLASQPIAEELKRYQDLVHDEGEEELARSESPAATTSGAPNPMLASAPVVRTEPQFWILRQRVYYEKQAVILAPPGAPPPVSPQLAASSAAVHAYEAANPEIHTSPKTWSGARVAALAARPSAPERRLHPPRPPGRPPEPPRARKRRRRYGR